MVWSDHSIAMSKRRLPSSTTPLPTAKRARYVVDSPASLWASFWPGEKIADTHMVIDEVVLNEVLAGIDENLWCDRVFFLGSTPTPYVTTWSDIGDDMWHRWSSLDRAERDRRRAHIRSPEFVREVVNSLTASAWVVRITKDEDDNSDFTLSVNVF